MNRRGLGSFNVYDVFANIVPGVVLLIGLLFPLDVREIVDVEIVSVTIASLFVILSFVSGQIVQSFGGWADGDHGFSELMTCLIQNKKYSRFELTEFDERFLLHCDETFDLRDEFDDYGRLFKMILAYLEYSGRTRALRMQALYLFARGIWVSVWLLALWFLIIGVSMRYEYLSNDSLELVNLRMNLLRSEGAIWFAFIIVILTGILFHRVRSNLELDWIQYTVSEFCLDRSVSNLEHLSDERNNYKPMPKNDVTRGGRQHDD